MQNLLNTILYESEKVDEKFDNITNAELSTFNLDFAVPSFHPRYKDIQRYSVRVGELTSDLFHEKQIVFADRGIQKLDFVQNIFPSKNIFFEEAREETLKEWHWLQSFLQKQRIPESNVDEVVGIGGGLTLNVAAYVAELLKTQLTQIPTTVIGMADGSGGKVRLNMIDQGRFFKHYYKSYYEPNQILLDPRFLESLSMRQIATGLGEIFKHGVYQSPALLKYLLSDHFNPENDKVSLLKVILWTVALKAVCLKCDVEENANGSRKILRGGHEFSDRLEEDLHFTIPHGFAVSIGMYRDLEMTHDPLLPKVSKLFEKFSVPKTVEEFRKL